MITPTQIENAVADVLRKNTGFKVYENDVKKTFKAPCFFVSCENKEFQSANKNTFKLRSEIEIIFFPPTSVDTRTRSEPLELKVMGLLPTWFSPNFKVGDRYLTTSNGNFYFLGDDGDILQYRFSTTYFDSVQNDEEYEKINKIILSIKEE